MQPYSYFHTQADRQHNPLTVGVGWGLLAGLGVLAAGTGLAMAAVKAKDTKKQLGPGPNRPKPKPSNGVSALSGVYAEGATLGAITDSAVLSGIHGPLAISMYDINEGSADGQAPTASTFPTVTRAETLVTRGTGGDMIPLEYLYVLEDGGVGFKVDLDALLAAGNAMDMSGDVMVAEAPGGQGQILRLVTDLTGPAATAAYKKATELVAEKNYLLDEPSGTRDDYVRQVLVKLAPDLDWNVQPGDLQVGTPAWATWMGVDLVGQVAYQNFWSGK